MPQLQSFTAIDFETAHPKMWSICQIGLVRVENGRVLYTINKLVQPPDNYYHPRFIDIHGIKPEATANAPTFDKVWASVKPFIYKQHVVAHNSAFDVTCLKQVLAYYSLEIPEFKKHCTYKLYRKGLSALCKIHSIELNHHDALSDANACAQLYLMHLKKQKVA
ncbi:MAG TPA: 3'-5' exonuclease [Bacteroidia bacterium]|jgi:DNA polymerase-3 subunit epsilon|nr:3'-5' exonuclease [Bacteroidia bacterium]